MHCSTHRNSNAASRAKAKYKTCYRRINYARSSVFTVCVFSSILLSDEPPLSPPHWPAASLNSPPMTLVFLGLWCEASNMTIQHRLTDWLGPTSWTTYSCPTSTNFLPLFQLFSYCSLDKLRRQCVWRQTDRLTGWYRGNMSIAQPRLGYRLHDYHLLTSIIHLDYFLCFSVSNRGTGFGEI